MKDLVKNGMTQDNIINLTGHEIRFIVGGEVKTIIEPSGIVLRVNTIRNKIGYLLGLPIYQTRFSGLSLRPILDLLKDEKNIFIVSKITLEAINSEYPSLSERFYIVDELVRNGREILGAKSFAQILKK